MTCIQVSVGEQRCHLARAKLALLAADTASTGGAAAAADARLAGEIVTSTRLCVLQAEVQGGYGEPRLQPVELAHLCLGAPEGGLPGAAEGGDDDRAAEGVLAAFEVFVIMGVAFCRANAALVEAAWGRAAELTDWAGLAAERAKCSDERFLERLAVRRPPSHPLKPMCLDPLGLPQTPSDARTQGPRS